MIIPFDEWTPDRAAFGHATTKATNVIPTHDGYRPLADFATQSDALTGRCWGAVSAQDSSANTYVYAGDSTKLYELTDQAFTDQSGTTYSLAAGDVWDFAVFGVSSTPTIIATNFTDAVQSISVGGGGSGNFADHITSTSKPKAKWIGVWGDYLVLGNTSIGGTHVPHKIVWSAQADSTDFDASATTLSGSQELIAENGWVQRIVDGVEYGIVFQERAIVRADFVGSPLIWRFDVVDRKRGTPIPRSVTWLGRNVFYITEEGFMVFDGTTSHPIGDGKVDRTFWNQFDVGDKEYVSAAVDPINKVVAWSFPGTGNSAGEPNKVYFCHWPTLKWSEADIDTQLLLKTATQGFTLDGLDSVMSDIDAGLGLTVSFDDEQWRGGALRFAAFTNANKLAFFTGNNLAATMDTKEAEPNPGHSTRTTGVAPLVDGGTLTCALGKRNILTDSVSFGSDIGINNAGECRVNGDSRYQTYRVKTAASDSWTHAQGVELRRSKRTRRRTA